MKRFRTIPLLLSFLASTAALSHTAFAAPSVYEPQSEGPITHVMLCPPECACLIGIKCPGTKGVYRQAETGNERHVQANILKPWMP